MVLKIEQQFARKTTIKGTSLSLSRENSNYKVGRQKKEILGTGIGSE